MRQDQVGPLSKGRCATPFLFSDEGVSNANAVMASARLRPPWIGKIASITVLTM